MMAKVDHVSPVVGCARCGDDHPAISFVRFERPVPSDDGESEWAFWGECPTNGDPILQRVVKL